MAVGQGSQLEQVGLLYVSALELIGWPTFFQERFGPAWEGVSYRRLALVGAQTEGDAEALEVSSIWSSDSGGRWNREPVILTRAVQAGLKGVLGSHPCLHLSYTEET